MGKQRVLHWIKQFAFVFLAVGVMGTACLSRTSDSGESPKNASGAAGEGTPGGALIKEVIVNYLRAAAKHPELQQERELEWSVFKLLGLFDSLRDQASLQALGNLEAFYLGEAPGEMLDCLIVRKGKSIAKILSDLKRTGSQDCREQLGANSKTCRPDDELRREVDILMKRIEAKEACDLEP